MGVTAAPIPIKLIINDEEETRSFLFSRMSDRDNDTINEWIRSRIVRVARKAAQDQADMTDAERQSMVDRAVLSASAESFMTPVGIRSLASVEGMAFLSWLSLRREAPDITIEQLESWLTDPRNLMEVNDAFNRASGKGIKPGNARAARRPMTPTAKRRQNSKKKKTKRTGK
jgi:hypothetical protein